MSGDATPSPSPPWRDLAAKALAGEAPTLDEGLAVLAAGDDQLLALMDAAFEVRRHYFGRRVRLNMLLNIRSGGCGEDCAYCSQSKVAKGPVETYPTVDHESILAGAHEAVARGAGTFCIVASGRAPGPALIDRVIDAVEAIKAATSLKVCASLGLLADAQAQRLADAGVDRYNHNVNTSEGMYERICQTHSYADRLDTIAKVEAAGISPCCGVIIGMGESDEQIVGLALELRQMRIDSIPVNFLHPIPGTPLENVCPPSPSKCLKALALFRFVCPDREIRVAGGREENLRSLQPMALYAANSIFVGDYLTTSGQDASLDQRMIEDMGFEIEPLH